MVYVRNLRWFITRRRWTFRGLFADLERTMDLLEAEWWVVLGDTACLLILLLSQWEGYSPSALGQDFDVLWEGLDWQMKGFHLKNCKLCKRFFLVVWLEPKKEGFAWLAAQTQCSFPRPKRWRNYFANQKATSKAWNGRPKEPETSPQMHNTPQTLKLKYGYVSDLSNPCELPCL